MPHKLLLETYPLYKKVDVVLPLQRHKWPKPAIKAHCPFEGSDQTYNMLNDYDQYDVREPKPVPGGYMPQYSGVVRLVYGCAACGRSRRYFLVLVAPKQPPARGGRGIPVAPATEAPAQIQKVGQFPAWDISPDPALARKLGPRVKTFKDGLICESQGFGLGAFAYYRRIVEEVIDELLEDIRQIVPTDSAPEYAAALEAAQSSHRAADKIERVKDLLPLALRPGGANPLALLHTLLSQGLHEFPDEQCLEFAGVLRKTLVHMVHQLNEAKGASDQYTKDLQLLLQRQNERAKAELPQHPDTDEDASPETNLPN